MEKHTWINNEKVGFACFAFVKGSKKLVFFSWIRQLLWTNAVWSPLPPVVQTFIWLPCAFSFFCKSKKKGCNLFFSFLNTGVCRMNEYAQEWSFCWSWAEITLTLLRTTAVSTGPGVGCVLGVAGGSTVPRPIKIIVLVLGEHADGLLFKAAVELSWRATEQNQALTCTSLYERLQ